VYYGINDLGHTVGQRFYCQQGPDLVPCGILNKDGVQYEIKALAARETAVLDINNAGKMVGYVVSTAGVMSAASCTLTGCGLVPPAALGSPKWSTAWRVNDGSQLLISKAKYTLTFPRRLVYSECLLTGNVCVDLPAISPGGLAATRRYALNNLGHTGGVWYNADQSKGYGFIQADGATTMIEYPGALITTVTGINDLGHAAGRACLTASRTYWLAGATCTSAVGFKWVNGEFETFPAALQDLNAFDTAAGE
jgi:hypothetical protein